MVRFDIEWLASSVVFFVMLARLGLKIMKFLVVLQELRSGMGQSEFYC